MVKHNLHEGHHAVVHRSSKRTRLRVPKKYRKHEKLHEVKQAIQEVPGVTSVEVNPNTGSVLVHHEEKPGIVGEIGAAIEETMPELMAALLLPEEEVGEVSFEVVSKLFKRFLLVPRENAPDAGQTRQAFNPMPDANADLNMRRAVPLAFVAVGFWQMIEQEALLGSLAPLALFYYGFDIYWKMEQQALAKTIDKTTVETEQLQKSASKTVTTATADT